MARQPSTMSMGGRISVSAQPASDTLSPSAGVTQTAAPTVAANTTFEVTAVQIRGVFWTGVAGCTSIVKAAMYYLVLLSTWFIYPVSSSVNIVLMLAVLVLLEGGYWWINNRATKLRPVKILPPGITWYDRVTSVLPLAIFLWAFFGYYIPGHIPPPAEVVNPGNEEIARLAWLYALAIGSSTTLVDVYEVSIGEWQRRRT